LKKSKSWGPFWSYQPILADFLVNGPNWQRCLAGSFKTAPTILIFSVALGAKYAFHVKSIANKKTTKRGRGSKIDDF
jgi:hypothetical protein